MGDVLAVVGPVLAVLLAVGWYLSYTAVRLDRLHTQNIATTAALDAQVVRRADATVDAAYGGDLDPASAALLLDAAGAALALTGEWSPQRCAAETELTEVLRVVVPEPGPALRGAAERVQLARRFHNEVVDRTLQVRRRRVVRVLHLAGRRPLPGKVVFDDAWPQAP
jgi:hypothetical protein